MLVLLLCAVLAELFQPGVISQAKSSLLTQGERTYKESPMNFMGQFMIALFRLGMLSMAVYLCCRHVTSFTFTGFWVVFGIALAVTVGKMICHQILDYTFRLSRRFGDVYEHYGNIVTLVTMLLYPVLLFLLLLGYLQVNRIVFASVVLLFMLLWLYRAFRMFVHSPRDIIYLAAYMCTLEVLPLAILYKLSDKTISIL